MRPLIFLICVVAMVGARPKKRIHDGADFAEEDKERDDRKITCLDIIQDLVIYCSDDVPKQAVSACEIILETAKNVLENPVNAARSFEGFFEAIGIDCEGFDNTAVSGTDS